MHFPSTLLLLLIFLLGPLTPVMATAVASTSFTFTPRLVNSTSTKCVQLYYDRLPGKDYTFGRIHMVFLQNLMAHFPHIKQYVAPIESYRSQDLEKCFATIYLGTNYFTQIPSAFIQDYVQTKKNVLWAGYNIWKLGADALATLWQVEYSHLSSLNIELKDPQQRPTFFKYYSYKGEEFSKYGEFDRLQPERFNAAFEIPIFKLLSPQASNYTLSWARHSGTGEKVPYLLQNKNHWYMGDSPFSFAHEDDRYLIICDLLFDLLEEEPLYQGKHPAIFRVEDVHPEFPPWMFFETIHAIAQFKIPFHVTFFPIFSGQALQRGPATMTTILSRPLTMEMLHYGSRLGAKYIFHGVSHQSGMLKNPLGISGFDFEFWDIKNNRPMPQDSTAWVLERLDFGQSLLQAAKIPIANWLTPHYQASPLDYVIFGQVFQWNWGRIIYFPDVKIHLPQPLAPIFTYEQSGLSGAKQRAQVLKDLQVTYPTNLLPNGQFFPYEIYGDIYGQKIIPENLGNLQPFAINGVVHKTRSVEEIIATMKRNLVIRDSWASLFYHPLLLETYRNWGAALYPGDATAITRLITAAQNFGYQFIDVNEWQANNPYQRKPITTEVILEDKNGGDVPVLLGPGAHRDGEIFPATGGRQTE